MSKTSVAVVGVGGIGGSFAAYLSRNPDVSFDFCVRRPFDALRVCHPDGTELATVDGRVLSDPDDAAPVDWVLVATKAYQVESAAPWLRALCGPATVVAVLQNGVEHLERVESLVGPAAVVPGLVYVGGYATAPGSIVHTIAGET